MARRDQVTRKASIESIHAYGDTPDAVVARFRLLVHDRSSTAGSCPCCGSTTCKIIEDIPDIEVLIDTRQGGGRYLRSTFPGSRLVRRDRGIGHGGRRPVEV